MAQVHYFVALLSTLVVVTFAASVQAKPFLTVICEEPEGPRIDYGGLPAQKSGKQLNLSQDGYSGVSPTFVIDDTSLDALTYLFDNSKSAIDAGMSHRSARSARVLTLSGQMISAVEYGENSIAVFSLFPAIGVGFFTFHDLSPIGGADAKAATFVSKCTFTL